MNRFLLDTHILIWWVNDDPTLPESMRDIIADLDNQIHVSPVNIWEIEIKRRMGKLEVAPDYFEILAYEPFIELQISIHHAHLARNLPPVHKDPFDRMLIAQAKRENMSLITVDEKIKHYDVMTF